MANRARAISSPFLSLLILLLVTSTPAVRRPRQDSSESVSGSRILLKSKAEKIPAPSEPEGC